MLKFSKLTSIIIGGIIIVGIGFFLIQRWGDRIGGGQFADNKVNNSQVKKENENWLTYRNSGYFYSIDYPIDWTYAEIYDPEAEAKKIGLGGTVQFGPNKNFGVVSFDVVLRSMSEQIEKSKHSVSYAQEKDIEVNALKGIYQAGKIGGKGEPYKDIIYIYISRDISSTFVFVLNNIEYLDAFEKMYKSFKINK